MAEGCVPSHSLRTPTSKSFIPLWYFVKLTYFSKTTTHRTTTKINQENPNFPIQKTNQNQIIIHHSTLYTESRHYCTTRYHLITLGMVRVHKFYTLSRLNFLSSPKGLSSSLTCSSWRVSGRFITIKTPLSSFLAVGNTAWSTPKRWKTWIYIT